MALFIKGNPGAVTEDLVSGVYLLFGQSNMRGRGAIASADASLQSTISGASIWRPGSSDFATLEAGGNNLGYDASSFGPEMKFAYDLTTRSGTPEIHIIKYAADNKHLANETLADSFYPAGGTQYSNMIAYLDAAMTYYKGTLGLDLPIRGVLYHQGESDANLSRRANAYEANLTLLINTLRDYIEAEGYGIAGVPFVIGRPYIGPTAASSFPALSTVTAAQQAVTAALPAVYSFSCDSYTLGGDDIHFNATGQTSIGAKFATYF